MTNDTRPVPEDYIDAREIDNKITNKNLELVFAVCYGGLSDRMHQATGFGTYVISSRDWVKGTQSLEMVEYIVDRGNGNTPEQAAQNFLGKSNDYVVYH